MDELVAETVREIEEEQALQRKSAVSVFRSMLNQPALVSISSVNANFTDSSEAFNEFTVDLPRPILKVDTIQLLNANIPECTQNIPNTCCAFWYYRLNPYYGAVPNPLNLYMVRLLPSYYKPEFSDGSTYGFNQTFFDYQDVETQLVKSVVRDLAADNIATLIGLGEADIPTPDEYLPQVPFSANDIEITLDLDQNKFQMTGLNANLPLISQSLTTLSTNSYVLPFDVGETYALGEFVQYGAPTKILYKSTTAGNTGNFPFVGSSFWSVSTGDIGYSAATTYALGDFATYLGIAYRSLQAGNLNQTPSSSPTYWAIVQESLFIPDWVATQFYQIGTIVYVPSTYSFWKCKVANVNAFTPAIGSAYFNQYVPPVDGIYNRYLVAGYDDPNVAIRQGIQKKTWNPYNTFFAGNSSATFYNGVLYIPAVSQNNGVLFNTIPFQYPLTWDALNFYEKGDLVLYLGVYYEALKTTFAFATPTNTNLWKVRTNLTYSATTSYITGDVVVYSGNSYIALQNSKNQTPPTTLGNVNAYWQMNYWLRDYSAYQYSSITAEVGLHSISSRYDMIDYFASANYWTYPFPAGIPGQPYNPNPKRLLNSILGFTWNGRMDVTVLDGFEMFDRLANNTVVQLYNRIRPVPQYQVSFFSTETVGVGENAVENPTFTANGYANLVYTSVVAIYGSIAGARTLDTQRNTSLLGMTSMNADNLGVSFYGNYIDSELIANEEDLYSISIQLYDEFNEPFVLTNNAVVTLTFKMTYKNK